MKKTTVVLGASPNESRYSNRAVKLLSAHQHPVIPIGVREGQIEGIPIITESIQIDKSIDTITLYLSPERQKGYYDYILGLSPKRIIFNPGTENPELIRMAKSKGIETEIACTLVLLHLGDY